MQNAINNAIDKHQAAFDSVKNEMTSEIAEAAKAMIDCLKSGHKILLCGNGGSAADAQHIAAELVGRFIKKRKPLPAIALTTDSSALTSIGNDFGFDLIFSRQVEALALEGDLLVAISTSGNSPNVLAALDSAKKIGCRTIALTGASGGGMARQADLCLKVGSTETPRIQEMHILIGHMLCDLIDSSFGP